MVKKIWSPSFYLGFYFRGSNLNVVFFFVEIFLECHSGLDSMTKMGTVFSGG